MSLFGTEPLTAAYGRKHTTLEEAQADFNKDKDFQTPSGRYTNRSDLAKMYPHLERIRVRFNRLEDTGYVLFKAELKPEPEPKPKPSRPTGRSSRCFGTPLRPSMGVGLSLTERVHTELRAGCFNSG